MFFNDCKKDTNSHLTIKRKNDKEKVKKKICENVYFILQKYKAIFYKHAWKKIIKMYFTEIFDNFISFKCQNKRIQFCMYLEIVIQFIIENNTFLHVLQI